MQNVTDVFNLSAVPRNSGAALFWDFCLRWTNEKFENSRIYKETRYELHSEYRMTLTGKALTSIKNFCFKNICASTSIKTYKLYSDNEYLTSFNEFDTMIRFLQYATEAVGLRVKVVGYDDIESDFIELDY